METRELFDLMERLYNTNVIGLSRLARALNISYNKLYVFINTLKRMEFEIIPCMNLRFLKLGIILVLSKDKIFDRECKPLFPRGYFTLLMVPLDIEFKNISSILSSTISVFNMYLIEEAQLPKPLLTKYNVDSSFHALKKEDLWNKLFEILNNISKNSFERYKTTIRYPERFRVNRVDLKIMSELTRDPFISSKKLAEKLGITVGKLRRRIVTRIEPLLKGYRVAWAPYYKLFNAVLFTALKVRNLPSRMLYEVLSEFPLTILTTYNSSENIIINAWLTDSITYEYLNKYLRRIEQEYGVEVIDTWGYLYSGAEKQVIPCKVLVEYDKKTRRLRLKSSSSIHQQ